MIESFDYVAHSKFHLSPIDQDKVLKAIQELKNATVRVNEISANMLESAAMQIVYIHSHASLFWKGHSSITLKFVESPMHKADPESNVANYRPSSFSCVMS